MYHTSLPNARSIATASIDPLLAHSNSCSGRQPWVEHSYSHGLEIGRVAGDDCKPMNQRSGSDQRVALRAWVGYMELGADPRDISVNSDNAAIELSDDDLLQPMTQPIALRFVASLNS